MSGREDLDSENSYPPMTDHDALAWLILTNREPARLHQERRGGARREAGVAYALAARTRVNRPHSPPRTRGANSRTRTKPPEGAVDPGPGPRAGPLAPPSRQTTLCRESFS